MKHDPELAALLAPAVVQQCLPGLCHLRYGELRVFLPRTSGVWWQSSMRSLTSVGLEEAQQHFENSPY